MKTGKRVLKALVEAGYATDVLHVKAMVNDCVSIIERESDCNELAAALESVATMRQFGKCWCNTADGTYCVGQKQCKEAQVALKKHRGE